MIVKVLFKPRLWFECNAYKDVDGEYWETFSLCDNYDIGKKFNASFTGEELDVAIPNLVLGSVWQLPEDQVKNKMWGIEEVYTPETHPEHFI